MRANKVMGYFNDLVLSSEKISGIELDWYLMDWTQTTKTID